MRPSLCAALLVVAAAAASACASGAPAEATAAARGPVASWHRPLKARRHTSPGWARSISTLRGGAVGKGQQQQQHKALRGGHTSGAATESPVAVFLYYPNIVGYARVAAVLTSYYLARTHWRLSSAFYVLAFMGDAVDGMVARRFNQSSSFGAILDMVTDRCSTAGMLFVLASLYPAHAFPFMCLMFLDIFSHWLHVQSVATRGHHKSAETLRGRNALIRLFYGCYPFFAYCCVCTEFFYVLLYLLYFNPGGKLQLGGVTLTLRGAALVGCLPACVCKQAVNVAQLAAAAVSIAEADVAKRQLTGRA